jgi:hypothetical protein
MKRHVFINGKEKELALDKDQYVYIIGLEPFKPVRVKVKDTFSSWILFFNESDCIKYY